MHVLALRMLLISSMVLWSPAMCCCAIRAMGSGEAGAACCSRSVPADEDSGSAGRSCCASRGSELGEEAPPCRCADRVIEQQRLDTSATLAAPRVELDGHVAVAGDALQRMSRACFGVVTMGGVPDAHPPPRGQTLVAQFCMLLL